MFPIMRNSQFQESQLIGEALPSITALLPASWRLEPQALPLADRGTDAILSLVGPAGTSVTFLVEARRSGTATGLLLAKLRELATSTELPVMFVSDYIGPSLRAALAGKGISYADATGWVRISSEVPLILITGQGAEKSPRAGSSTAVVRFSGVAVSRIIRALCMANAPVGVRELAALADVSPGSVSKLLSTLATEAIIDRDQPGAVTAVRRRALIQRWVRDYSFAKTNRSVGYFIASRGLGRTLPQLADLPEPVAVTGSPAARLLLPEGTTSVVPLRLLSLYCATPSMLAEDLGLVPADPATANTVLAVPQDGSVLDSSIAPVALVLADLLTLPGRGDAEAEQLMDALSRTDQAWAP